MEIDKYVNMSIKDFVPSNSQDTSIHFDDLGIMKQVWYLFLSFYEYIIGKRG
jgi:hypothetical protein